MLPWREDIFPSLPDRLECRDPLDWSSLAESWKRNITDLYIHIKYMYKFTKRHIRYLSFLLYRNCQPMKLNRGFKTRKSSYLTPVSLLLSSCEIDTKVSLFNFMATEPWLTVSSHLKFTKSLISHDNTQCIVTVWSGHNYFLWEDRHSIITMLFI